MVFLQQKSGVAKCHRFGGYNSVKKLAGRGKMMMVFLQQRGSYPHPTQSLKYLKGIFHQSTPADDEEESQDNEDNDDDGDDEDSQDNEDEDDDLAHIVTPFKIRHCLGQG